MRSAENGHTKICVLGLGQVGLPTAQYVASAGKGLEVVGYDINPDVAEKARKCGIDATNVWNDIPAVDIYIICVSTLTKDQPYLSPVFDVSEKISKKEHSPSLVSIESTIVPGVSRKIYENIFNERINLVHVPHRFWAEDPARHGVKQLRVIGAVSKQSLDLGLEFYGDILEIPLHVASSIEIAEISKIAENSYRYVQIAFAEELRLICESVGLAFNEVREACNSKWNIEIQEAREGIGGHCLPKDIRHLASLTPYNALLNSALLVDEEYRRWLSKKT